jgi:glycosyltransferase involved in cell wall biosynthesis
VLSSRYEPFGLVTVEALALGTRVVATDCPGGVREILRDCSGYRLVKEGDPGILADAILQTVMGKRRQVKENNDVSRFDVVGIVAQYEALFHKVIDEET